MFFYAAKILWFFVQPLNLAIFLLLAGLLAGLFGWRRMMAVGGVLAFLILAICAWTSAGALLLQPLEDRFARPAAALENVAGIVVLGGGLEGQINLARGGYEVNRGGDRFIEAAALAHRYPQARILVSGGDGSLVLAGEGDAATAPRLLGALGVEPERLILENKSRDTYENAVFSKQMVQPKPGETWLLVTSAFHMPRSMGLFRAAGFDVVPWPTDYRTTGKDGLSLFADDSDDALNNSKIAIREWIGLVAYWLTGRIDSPLPGPS
jgi:uncharacterized SAM-binding protein YcdF (DUF218 family)